MRPALAFVSTLALGALLCAAPRPAEAGFRSLHRQTGASHLDAAFSFVMPPDEPDVLRSELYGELSLGSFGGYVALPFARSLEDDLDVSEVGNVELGLLAELGEGPLSLVAHAGFTLETIDAGGADDAAVLAIGTLPRLQDAIPASTPQLSTIRLGVTPRAHSGAVFGQLDLGIDFHLVDGDGGGEDFRSYHVGVGAGVELDWLELTGEFVHLDRIGSGFTLGSRKLELQSAGATATLELSILEPFVAYHTLLDDTDVHMVSFGLSLLLD